MQKVIKRNLPEFLKIKSLFDRKFYDSLSQGFFRHNNIFQCTEYALTALECILIRFKCVLNFVFRSRLFLMLLRVCHSISHYQALSFTFML